MPTERNFYDEQFAHRINQIAKPGATPSSGSSTSSSRGWGWKGSGLGILAVIVIRAFMALGSSNNYSSRTYQYTPPPSITFPTKRFELPEVKDEEKWREILNKTKEQPPPVFPPPQGPFEQKENDHPFGR